MPRYQSSDAANSVPRRVRNSVDRTRKSARSAVAMSRSRRMPISAGSGSREMVTCVPSRSARRERRRASAMPGGLELGGAVAQVDQAGGGSLEVGGRAELVGGGEGGDVGRVAGLGAGVELDDQRLLLAGEGAQPLEEPGEEAVGIGGRSVPDRAVGHVGHLSTEAGWAEEGLGDAADLAVVIEQHAGRRLAGERGALAPGPRSGGDRPPGERRRTRPSGAVDVVGAAEDGRHRLRSLPVDFSQCAIRTVNPRPGRRYDQ